MIRKIWKDYMKRTILFLIGFSSFNVMGAQSIYCPQKQGYINVGMSASQVVAACGQPLSRKITNQPPTQKIPVTQLIYTSLNQGSVYSGLNSIYNQWSLPSGSKGVSLEVDIINNKVSSVRLNGSGTNAATLCGGNNVQVGDDENRVYNACGNPSLVNNTFINQPIPTNSPPEVWIYQVDQFQPAITLTIVNGKLQSID
jgi:hypothetical protein